MEIRRKRNKAGKGVSTQGKVLDRMVKKAAWSKDLKGGREQASHSGGVIGAKALRQQRLGHRWASGQARFYGVWGKLHP